MMIIMMKLLMMIMMKIKLMMMIMMIKLMMMIMMMIKLMMMIMMKLMMMIMMTPTVVPLEIHVRNVDNPHQVKPAKEKNKSSYVLCNNKS